MKSILKCHPKCQKALESFGCFYFADKSKVNNVQFMTTKSMKMV